MSNEHKFIISYIVMACVAVGSLIIGLVGLGVASTNRAEIQHNSSVIHQLVRNWLESGTSNMTFHKVQTHSLEIIDEKNQPRIQMASENNEVRISIMDGQGGVRYSLDWDGTDLLCRHNDGQGRAMFAIGSDDDGTKIIFRDPQSGNTLMIISAGPENQHITMLGGGEKINDISMIAEKGGLPLITLYENDNLKAAAGVNEFGFGVFDAYTDKGENINVD